MLVGFPLKEYQLCDTNGQPEWVSEKLLDYYLSTGYQACGQVPQRMSYAVPAWVPRDEKSTILLLDDFSRADPRYLQATMELISRGEYISWQLPKNCHIVLSSNPDTGDYNVSSMDAAQRTRYIKFNVGFNLDTWAEWAENAGIDSRIISFALFYPEIFKDPHLSGVTPRTIVMFANAISGIEDFANDDSLVLINLISDGCFESKQNVIGQYFSMFINNKLDKLVTPRDILLSDWGTLESKLKKQVYDGVDYRSDVASILVLRLLNYIDVYFDQSDCKSDVVVDRVIKLIESKHELLTNDLVFQVVKRLTSKHSQRCAKLLLNKKTREIVGGGN